MLLLLLTLLKLPKPLSPPAKGAVVAPAQDAVVADRQAVAHGGQKLAAGGAAAAARPQVAHDVVRFVVSVFVSL